MNVAWHSNGSVSITRWRRRHTPLVETLTDAVCVSSLALIAPSILLVLLQAREGYGWLTKLLLLGYGYGMASEPSGWRWLAAKVFRLPIVPTSSLTAHTIKGEAVLRIWIGIGLVAAWRAWIHLIAQIPEITTETLTVSRGLGVQVQWFRNGEKKFVRFIPVESIKEIAVVEAFQNFRIVSTLNIILNGPAENTVVPFRHTMPLEEDLWVLQDLLHTLLFKKAG